MPAQGQGASPTLLALGFSLGFLGTWSLRRATLATDGKLSRREAVAKARQRTLSPCILASNFGG